MIPFQQKWYYTPEMKRELFHKVRSTLHLFLNYHITTLILKKEVQHLILFFLWLMRTFEGDVQKTRRQLLEYCELDTYAMVKILEKLLQV